MQTNSRSTGLANAPGWKALCGSAALLFVSASAPAAVTGQWDFDNGNLNATKGQPLTYAEGNGGETQAGTSFGTTTSLGIPNIGSTEAKVMKFGAYTIPAGYAMPNPPSANGGGGQVNQWTLVMDVLYPAASNGKFRAIVETDGGLTPDADVFVNTGNGFGVGSYGGTVSADAWHRLAVVVDTSVNELRFYIDGAQVLVRNAGNATAVDGRWSLSAGGVSTLFADDNGEAAGGYVNSIQIYDEALSKGQVLALGGASAAGLPATLPPVPSSVDKWIPSGAYAKRDTSIGAYIDPGSTTIDDNTIALSLDGAVAAGPTVTHQGNLIKVEKLGPELSLGKHKVVLTYTDSLAGVRNLTNEFTAALYYEDFESVVLRANLDEPAQVEKAWTHTPPTGWAVDNSQFEETIINPDTNPDDNGDGFADNDGRTEWAGWSFAPKSFWLTADDQRRSEFNLGENVVAIADPDEWDDQSHNPGLFNSLLTSPAISVKGLAANSVTLAFASSWRPEAHDDGLPNFPVDETTLIPLNNQTAKITASFDGGAPVTVMLWDSADGSPTRHGDAPNESVLLSIPNPAGAQNMVLTFALLLGANDWWWAIDNVAVSASASGQAPPAITTAPSPVVVNEGEAAALTVVATGDGLNYLWYKGQGTGQSLIAGANTATLSFNPAKIEDAGYYTVVVSNSVATASKSSKITVLPKTDGRVVLLNENFNGIALGPNVEEGIITGSGGAQTAVWSKAGPAGWTIDDTGVPGVGTDQDGVTEWAGWSFTDRAWWAMTTGDQQRTGFLKGTGAIAVVDSDEWDDVAHADGNMASYLKSKPISLAGAKANSLIVQFDSSWRPEEPQKATVTASFDGGAAVPVVTYDSTTTNPNYRPDEVNETIAVRVNNPAGAQNVVLTFGYFDTRNNWWWAFDNLLVLADKPAIYSENFEGIALGPNTEEGIITGSGGAKPNVWSKAGPAGWTIDDTGVPGVGTDQDGVTEWAGWSFANREWWAATTGDQQRTQFLKGQGAVAIADSDEWDDVAHADGNMATYLTTGPINIAGQAAGTLSLQFDSSWRPEEPQKATVTVSYDGAAAKEVLRFESAAGSASFHPDSVNETVKIPLQNPAGATSMKITFGYFDTRNNWWWAIDNLEVTAGAPVGTPPTLVFKLTGNQLELSWTGDGFTLQENADVANTAGWTAVAGAGANSATVPATAAAKFYRLKK